MTLFTIQNQIAVKLLAVLTILMMVASLVPASVFAQAEGETPTEPTAEEQEIIDPTPVDDIVEAPAEEDETLFESARAMVMSLVTCSPQTNVTGPTSIQNIDTLDYFNTVNDALADCDTQDGNTIALSGNISITQQITIGRPITLDGNGYTISPTFAKTDNDNNSSIGIIDTEDVIVKDVVIDGTGGTNLHGVNVYRSTNVDILDVTINNPKRTGVVVNGSDVTVSNLKTSGSTWHAINANPGSGVTSPTVLTINGVSVHGEPAPTPHIFIDDISKDVTINDTNSQYEQVFQGPLNPNSPNIISRSLRLKEKQEVTVVATKLVCTDETDLPNWGNGGQGPITADTAADWVEEHDSCDFASDWQFQYANQSGADTAGDFVGEAEGYTTFENPTDETGVTTDTILLGKNVSELHLREVLQDDYLPFSKDNQNNVSAEFYCANDVLNYDNWDFIRNPQAGETYYCVAWNVPTEIPQEPVCEVGKNLLQNGSFEDTPTVTDNGGQWQIFTAISNWIVGLSDGIEVWNTFNGVSDDVASDGLQNVELDGNNATRLTQAVTTIPGATYELKFDFSARATIGTADNVMAVLVDGATVDTVNGDGTGTTTNAWTPQSQTFVAASTSTTIGFEDIGTANDNGGYGPILDNVALCLVREPEPLPTCSLTIKSDVNDYVVEKNAMAQLMSYIHPSWVTAIGTSTAAWIWGDNPVVNPLVNETQTFKKSFNWTGGIVTGATLKLASDNSHAVTLGSFTGGNPGEFNYGAVTSYNVASGITAGANTLEIEVENFAQANGTQTSNPAGLIYELTITGTGESCGTIVPEVPKTTGTVTMCKVDENEEPLAGWTMALLGNKVEDVVVPANTSAGINTTNVLNAGKSYVALASGTWNNQGGANPVDAEYSTTDGWATQMDGYTGYQDDILELQINSAFDPNSDWGAYNSGHNYAQAFVPVATGTTNFRIFDGTGTTVDEGWYPDNSGTLNVAVYEGFAGITGKNGCVTFTDVPYGEYTADEIMQDGWEQVEGAGDVSVTYNNPTPTITIMNEMEDDGDDDNDPETYTLDGYKYQYYSNGDGGYNEDGTIAGWTIYATNGEDELSTTTDETGYYYFEVEEGDWTVSESMWGGWEQVDIDVEGGEIVDQTCEFEVGNYSDWTKRLSALVWEPEYSCDFGNYYDDDGDNEPRTYTVTGFKWNDVDGDGVKDAEEGKLANWLITATQGSTSVATTTNASGNYTLLLPYDEGTWIISETAQSGWTQTGLYQNGVKVTLGSEVSNNCSFNLGSYAPTATCDFGNKQNAVVNEEPETPNRNGGGGSGTRITNRATPQGLVLGAATGTPACGMYLNDYMRMGNAASTTQITKLQVFLNAVGIVTPLTGTFDAATDASVRTFQAQHKAEVLTPWYQAKIVPHENPTGWVYQLTRWKINNIVCPGSEAYPVLN